MAESYIERLMRQNASTPQTSLPNLEWEETRAETRTCPDCGAPRSEAYDAAECRYCGHVFMSALASEYARRDPHSPGAPSQH